MRKRLIEFLLYLGLGQNKFEEIVGLSRGFVNKVGDSIREGNLKKISSCYPELNINWLKTGEGEMLVSSEPKQHTDANVELELEIEKLKVELDLKDKFIQSLEDRIKDKEETIQAQKETIKFIKEQLESTKKGQTFATQRT